MALSGFLGNAVKGIQQNSGTQTPVPTVLTPQPSLLSRIGSGIGNFMNGVGNSVINQVQQGGQNISKGLSEGDPSNPNANLGNLIQGGQDIITGIGQGAGAIAAPLMDIISKGLQGNPDQPNIISSLSSNPAFQRFANSSGGRILAKAADITGGVANDLGTAAGIEGTVEDLNAPKVKTETTPTTLNAPEDAQKIASDSIQNPLNAKEQQSALRGGRLSDSSIPSVTNPNPSVSYEPDGQTVKMTKALQPLAEDGRLKPPTTLENQVNNIQQVTDELNTQKTQLREGLKTSNAIWNSNELKGQLNEVNVPDPVKNEPTLARNVTSLKNATVKLAEDVSKKTEGLLDLRQNFDSYVKENYGKEFFDKGRNANPFHSYVYSLRDKLTDFAASKLPEGKLPDGTSYQDALQNQHQLINAQDEMVAKTTREYPEGSKPSSRFMQAHPLLKKALTREALGVGIGVLGGAAVTAAAKKVIPYAISKIEGN